jgi:hypothetical protein
MLRLDRRVADHHRAMSVPIQRTQEPEVRLLGAPPASLLSEVRALLGGFDRPTVIFWSTQIFCWLIVVAIAMLWGIGGL